MRARRLIPFTDEVMAHMASRAMEVLVERKLVDASRGPDAASEQAMSVFAEHGVMEGEDLVVGRCVLLPDGADRFSLLFVGPCPVEQYDADLRPKPSPVCSAARPTAASGSRPGGFWRGLKRWRRTRPLPSESGHWRSSFRGKECRETSCFRGTWKPSRCGFGSVMGARRSSRLCRAACSFPWNRCADVPSRAPVGHPRFSEKARGPVLSQEA